MTSIVEALVDLAPALYGERWKARLGEFMGVRRETVWGWATGHRPIPAKMEKPLKDILRLEIKRRREKFDKWEALLS